MSTTDADGGKPSIPSISFQAPGVPSQQVHTMTEQSSEEAKTSTKHFELGGSNASCEFPQVYEAVPSHTHIQVSQH